MKNPEKLKKKVIKSKKVNNKNMNMNLSKKISSAIISKCDSDQDIILIGLYKRSALIVKIKTETIRKELCPNSMTPVETFEEVTFFDTFIVNWESKNKINSNFFSNKNKELPVYNVETEREVIQAIENA